MKNKLATEAFEQMKAALQMFGEYTFEDVTSEVMDLSGLCHKFRTAGVKEAYDALVELRLYPGKYRNMLEILVAAILSELDTWDELWDSYGEELDEWL